MILLYYYHPVLNSDLQDIAASTTWNLGYLPLLSSNTIIIQLEILSTPFTDIDTFDTSRHKFDKHVRVAYLLFNCV